MAVSEDEKYRIVPRIRLREALRKDIARTPGGRDSAAPIIGVGGGQVVDNYTCETKRGYIKPDGDGVPRYKSSAATMSMDQFELLLDHTGALFSAHAVAEIAGGVFVPGVDFSDLDAVTVAAELTKILGRLSLLAATINDAVKDDVVDGSEWRAIRDNRVYLVESINRLVSLAAAMRG